MAVNFVLQVNNNRKSDYYGQQVARVKLLGNIDTDKVAEIIQRNASVKRSDVKAVLAELAEVIAGGWLRSQAGRHRQLLAPHARQVSGSDRRGALRRG